MRARRSGVALEHLACGFDRLRDELAVALEIREAQKRRAALPLAEVFARPAQLEVALRDVETTGAFEDDLQSCSRSVGKRLSVQQDAYALARATADPSAQLMELR